MAEEEKGSEPTPRARSWTPPVIKSRSLSTRLKILLATAAGGLGGEIVAGVNPNKPHELLEKSALGAAMTGMAALAGAGAMRIYRRSQGKIFRGREMVVEFQNPAQTPHIEKMIISDTGDSIEIYTRNPAPGHKAPFPPLSHDVAKAVATLYSDNCPITIDEEQITLNLRGWDSEYKRWKENATKPQDVIRVLQEGGILTRMEADRINGTIDQLVAEAQGIVAPAAAR